MSRPHRVHELLTRDELDELEAFCREPATTVDAAHEWLLARGYTLSRGAVHNWKRTFDEEDEFRASNEVARALVDAAKSEGAVAISDAANLKLSQMLFEQLLRMQSQEQVDTGSLWKLSMSLKNAVAAKRNVEQLRGEIAAALDKAEADARTGAGEAASGEAVVSKVREILGIG